MLCRTLTSSRAQWLATMVTVILIGWFSMVKDSLISPSMSPCMRKRVPSKTIRLEEMEGHQMHCRWENKLMQSSWKSTWRNIPKCIKMFTYSKSAFSSLGIYLKKIEMGTQIYIQECLSLHYHNQRIGN